MAAVHAGPPSSYTSSASSDPTPHLSFGQSIAGLAVHNIGGTLLGDQREDRILIDGFEPSAAPVVDNALEPVGRRQIGGNGRRYRKHCNGPEQGAAR
jgi:hypothetical protein